MKFTIFTPCYNGAHTIHRVFKSVETQTFYDFEWIIVNDGSTDDSHNIIQELIAKSPIKDKIIYKTQENSGKHITWNRVIKIAKGEWFIPADCDDSFIPETLAFFNDKLESNANVKLSGINVCCFNPDNGERIGSMYPHNGILSNNIELDYKYNIEGEHWGCINKELLASIPFPEVKGHFFGENYLWYSITKKGYMVACYNDMLRGYYFEANSLCNNKEYRRDPDKIYMGMYLAFWKLFNVGHLIFKYAPLQWVRLNLQCINAVRNYVIARYF